MQKSELMTEFYVNKDYEGLKSILISSSDAVELEYLARIYQKEQNYKKAAEIYKKLGLLYEYGRCELLQGNLNITKDIWSDIKDENPAVLWGKSLLGFIELYVTSVPTFFQIRAFLEVDLDALLKARLITYCDNIVNGAHFLEQNNQESYKFIGRVFVNNNYFELAELFLNKAKDVCYVDPEVHLMLAKCHLYKNNIEAAKNSLKISMEKGYGYFPAKRMLEQLENTK